VVEDLRLVLSPLQTHGPESLPRRAVDEKMERGDKARLWLKMISTAWMHVHVHVHVDGNASAPREIF
jgi:hypothetical protein